MTLSEYLAATEWAENKDDEVGGRERRWVLTTKQLSSPGAFGKNLDLREWKPGIIIYSSWLSIERKQQAKT